MSPKRADTISLRLSAPPKREQRKIDRERERRGMAAELPVERRRRAGVGRRREQSAGPGAAPGAERVGDAVADMAPERLVEGVEAARAVGVFQRQHFLEQIRMAADRALAELNEAAGDDIGAFHRDGDRHAAIEAAEIVQRPFDDAFAAVHVHGVVDRDAHALGRLRLHDGGDDGRMVAVVERRAGHAARAHRADRRSPRCGRAAPGSPRILRSGHGIARGCAHRRR